MTAGCIAELQTVFIDFLNIFFPSRNTLLGCRHLIPLGFPWNVGLSSQDCGLVMPVSPSPGHVCSLEIDLNVLSLSARHVYGPELRVQGIPSGLAYGFQLSVQGPFPGHADAPGFAYGPELRVQGIPQDMHMTLSSVSRILPHHMLMALSSVSRSFRRSEP